MKKSVKKLVHKLESIDSTKLDGGFFILSNVRGGNMSVTDPDPSVNDVCQGTNQSGCSNQRDCSGTTNVIGCHNYATCFTD
jgi:hypothetical protein